MDGVSDDRESRISSDKIPRLPRSLSRAGQTLGLGKIAIALGALVVPLDQ